MRNLIRKFILLCALPLTAYSNQEFETVCQPIFNFAHSIHATTPDGKIAILAIGGCPGVGKTVFTEQLSKALNNQGIPTLIFKMDDYIKDKKKRDQYGTGWDIRHLDVNALHEDLLKISQGEMIIIKPTLDEVTREKGFETLDLSKVRMILIEGLYSLSTIPPINYFQYADGGIYISAKEEDIFQWRWEREIRKSKPKTLDQFRKHMEDIFLDFHSNVEPTQNNANYIIYKNKDHIYTVNN